MRYILRAHMRQFKSSGCARRVTPRMMEYLRYVIDTPVSEATNNLNGKVSDEVIGQKMKITKSRIQQYRSVFAEKFTKEEILELCEEIMKEAA